MCTRFKTPYIDAHFVDEDGVVWVENTDGFLVENKVNKV